MASPSRGRTIAVYCASSMGVRKAFHNAALSVGRALVEANCSLVYGGGSHGIMGLVSGAVLEGGGHVTGIVPYAMVAAGGEGMGLTGAGTGARREEVEMIVVDSMHERKVEMAQRASAFLGLPGGFGTFEEILEVTTWNQIGMHDKPVVLLNVLAYFDPLRNLIRNALCEGYIQPHDESLIIFVDGPIEHHAHETYDWGKAALQAVDDWRPCSGKPLFDWKKRIDGGVAASTLDST